MSSLDFTTLPPLLRYAILAGAVVTALILARLILYLARKMLSLALTVLLALGLLYLFYRFLL